MINKNNKNIKNPRVARGWEDDEESNSNPTPSKINSKPTSYFRKEVEAKTQNCSNENKPNQPNNQSSNPNNNSQKITINPQKFISSLTY